MDIHPSDHHPTPAGRAIPAATCIELLLCQVVKRMLRGVCVRLPSLPATAPPDAALAPPPRWVAPPPSAGIETTSGRITPASPAARVSSLQTGG